MDRHHVSALPQSQGRKQTGNAKHVVEMTMGQQKTIEASKTGTAAQQLALCPLSAVHQNAVTSCLDEKGRMVAFSRWNARRRPQKGEREHRRPVFLVFV
jgi:hypothetical protein